MGSGTTSNYGFPYPQLSDEVNVDGDIRDLALSIDSGLQEIIQDKSASMITGGTHTGITVAYNDTSGTLSLTSTAPSDLLAHELDTTNVHGIADTSLLVTTSSLASDLALKLDKTNGTIVAPKEKVTIIASAPVTSGLNYFYYQTSSINYYTVANTNNFNIDIRGNESTTLNSILAIGESVAITLLVTNGNTAYMPYFFIDGFSRTTNWIGGYAPTGGNANSIDMYGLNIIKTASDTYTVLASQTKFA